MNLWGNDRRFDDYLQRIEGAFEGQVCCVPAAQRGNIIVLAFKQRPMATRWDELREQARGLEETLRRQIRRVRRGHAATQPAYPAATVDLIRPILLAAKSTN